MPSKAGEGALCGQQQCVASSVTARFVSEKRARGKGKGEQERTIRGMIKVW
jgi:hypothetical protein